MIDSLHPTELFFLENPKRVTFQKFITQTLVNLISKDVIDLQTSRVKDGAFIINKNILISGKELRTYNPQKFENIFTAPFKVNQNKKIELEDYLEKILSTKYDKWIKELANSNNLQGLINPTYTLNKNGLQLQKELLALIEKSNKNRYSKYFTILNIKDSSLHFSDNITAKKNNLFIDPRKINFDLSKIDIIYEVSIRVFSNSSINSKRYESEMNWKNYNTGSPGV